jgi:hypothetical protein
MKVVNYKGYGEPVDGWFFSPEFRYYQKVNGQAVVYLERMMYHYRLLLYKKGGEMGYCTLEARIESQYGPMKLFDLGGRWLENYKEWDDEKLFDDKYHIGNPNGTWGKGRKKKLHYINLDEEELSHEKI